MGGQLEDSHSGMRVFLFLGIGMMTDFLKGVGTTEAARDSLKMDVNKPAIWSAQDIRTRPVILSGPAAFLMFTLFSFLTGGSTPSLQFPPNLVLRHGDNMIIAALSAAS